MRSEFLRRAQAAIQNGDLQRALDQNAERRGDGRIAAFASLDGVDQIRYRAHAIRKSAVDNLPDLLDTFSQRIEANGWKVLRAETASEACALICSIAQEHGGKTIVKSKSMVTEEIGLNQALSRLGLNPVETDLGEFIVQLRGEPPGHIITPAIHLLREEVAATFVEHLGIEFTTDVSALNYAARRFLREVFRNADIGISGVNFGVADQGLICLVTNEGNGRMVTSLPEVHIAVMGIERLVASISELELMLQLLPRSATGQILSSYVSWIRSPRRASDLDGPAERFLILVDNGRSALRQSRLQAALMCIRCGACLNACPVYREIGGHTYESVYPGPIGSVISPGLLGLKRYGHLAKASTLCGACREVCPVDIDLPSLLLRTREEYIKLVQPSRAVSLGMKSFRWLNSSPQRYSFAIKTAAMLMKLLPSRDHWIPQLPGALHAWTRYRDFPPFQRRPFRDRFEELTVRREAGVPPPRSLLDHEPPSETKAPEDHLNRFREAVQRVDGEFRSCPLNAIESAILDVVKPGGTILVDPIITQHYPDLVISLEAQGIEVTLSEPCKVGDREELLTRLDDADAGLTLCLGAIAESGTLILGQDEMNSALTSLLPETHIAILPKNRVYDSLKDWIDERGQETLARHQSVTLITGPSRTADIEMTLTIGVHGPARLIVLAVDC